MPPLKLNVGIAPNDRMLPLLTGDVKAEGLDLTFSRSAPSDIFWRALHAGEFDVTEMSLAAFCILLSRGERPFIGLPVFTSRMFRHGCIYVSGRSAIETPADLSGKRVGHPEYQMTAAVWMRGILAEFHNVALDEIHWLTGGTNRPGRKERIPLNLPPAYRVDEIAPDETMNALLARGEVDAVISPQMPETFIAGDSGARRLFPDFRKAEQEYYTRSGIFPIMHLLVMRRHVYEENVWAARSLFDAFDKARERSLANLYGSDVLYVMLPWLVDEMEAAFSLMGRNFWPYGISANADVLSKFIDYLERQHLLKGRISVADLFAPELKEIQA